MMELPRRIYYTGSDQQAMKAIDKADGMRDVLKVLTSLRANHIRDGNSDRANELTRIISTVEGVTRDVYNSARQILKDLRIYGDPTI